MALVVSADVLPGGSTNLPKTAQVRLFTILLVVLAYKISHDPRRHTSVADHLAAHTTQDNNEETNEEKREFQKRTTRTLVSLT